MKTSISKNTPFWIATLAIIIMGNISAQSAFEAWVRSYNGLADSHDRARKVVLDSLGNAIVAGLSDAGMSGNDWVVIKYSTTGIPLWTNLYSGLDNSVDSANSVAVDGSDNVIVTGYSHDSHNDIFFDYVTIKYSAAGVPLWTNRFDRFPYLTWIFGNNVNAVAVDRNGNVFVTAISATVAYSSAGVPVWTNSYPGTSATDLSVDGSGNVVVTGYSGGGEGYHDYVTVKYSGGGVPLWTNSFISCGYGHGYTVAVDGSGNVFVAGSSCSAYATVAYSSAGTPLWSNSVTPQSTHYEEFAARGVALDGSGNVFVTGTSDADFATIKYSNAGVPLWTNLYNGPGNGVDAANAIAVDGSGNVFVTGFSSSNGVDSAYATIKYSGSGVPLWTNLYAGTRESQALSAVVDANGNLFVTGYSWTGSTYDFVTIKYSGTGVPLLTISRTPTNTVTLSWPSSATAFTLQQNTNGLASVNWSNAVTVPVDDGTNKTVILDSLISNAFYRLIHP